MPQLVHAWGNGFLRSSYAVGCPRSRTAEEWPAPFSLDKSSQAHDRTYTYPLPETGGKHFRRLQGLMDGDLERRSRRNQPRIMAQRDAERRCNARSLLPCRNATPAEIPETIFSGSRCPAHGSDSRIERETAPAAEYL